MLKDLNMVVENSRSKKCCEVLLVFGEVAADEKGLTLNW
jgi:hypothetical protein